MLHMLSSLTISNHTHLKIKYSVQIMQTTELRRWKDSVEDILHIEKQKQEDEQNCRQNQTEF